MNSITNEIESTVNRDLQELETVINNLWSNTGYRSVFPRTWTSTTSNTPTWFDKYKPTTFYRSFNTENGLIWSFDLPGFNKENLKVDVTSDNTLTIEGKRYFPETDTYEQLSKTYSIDTKTYDTSLTKAEITDGVLYVTFTKHKKQKTKVVSLI
jgi:HSP20 family molecular chaperone IbpA